MSHCFHSRDCSGSSGNVEGGLHHTQILKCFEIAYNEELNKKNKWWGAVLTICLRLRYFITAVLQATKLTHKKLETQVY